MTFKAIWNSPLVSFVREICIVYSEARIPSEAASFAYFVLLTLFPALICLSGCLGLLHLDAVYLVEQLDGFFPPAALEVIESYLSYISVQHSGGFFFAGLAGCWFSAAAAFRTIMRIISSVFATKHKSPLRAFITSTLFPLALLVTITLGVFAVVFGRKTLLFLEEHLPFLSGSLDIWSGARYILLFSVYFLFVLAVFNLAAPVGTPRRPILMSSLLSSLAQVCAATVFSLFLEQSSRYSLVYGSLVSIIILLVWLNLLGQILFISLAAMGVWHRRDWRSSLPRRKTDPQ